MFKGKQQYVRPPAVRGNTLVKRLSPQHGHLAQNQDMLPHRSQRCRSSVIHRPCQRMHDNYVSAICPSWAGLAMEAGVFMHRRCGVYTIGVSPCWVGKGHTMMSCRSLCTHSTLDCNSEAARTCALCCQCRMWLYALLTPASRTTRPHTLVQTSPPPRIHEWKEA